MGSKFFLDPPDINAQNWLSDVGATVTANDVTAIQQQFPKLKLTPSEFTTWMNQGAYGNGAMLQALKDISNTIANTKSLTAQQGITASSNSKLQSLTNLGNQMVNLINNALVTSNQILGFSNN